MTTPPGIWLVLPVKATPLAKSRLDLPGDERRRVALALADQTLAVAAQSTRVSHVVVVTSDPDVAITAAAHGMRVEPDPGHGLNSACECGTAFARSIAPADTVVVMVCDLPEITVGVLDSFIELVVESDGQPLHVPDTSGHGTTVISLPAGSNGQMVFGADSARRFRAEGHRSVVDVDRRLRFDLDTLSDLWSLPLTASIQAPTADAGRAGRARRDQALASR